MGIEVYQLLIALLLCCIGASGIPTDMHFNVHLQRSIKTDNVQYCGTQLASAISIVCNGNYNTLASVTRHQKRDEVQSPPRFPFKSREEANAFMRNKKRRRRGVSDECCKKACSYDELRSFCGPQGT